MTRPPTVRFVPKDATPPPPPAVRPPARSWARAGYWTPDRWAQAVTQIRGGGQSRAMTAARAVLVDGQTQEQAAASLGISRQVVRAAIHRVRRASPDLCPTCGQPRHPPDPE